MIFPRASDESWFRSRVGVLALALFFGVAGAKCLRAEQPSRRWTDLTGNFTVDASLVKLNGGFVYLKTRDGGHMKIAIESLSQVDRDFLNARENPFEVVDHSNSKMTAKRFARGESALEGSGGTRDVSTRNQWHRPPNVSWDGIPPLGRGRSENAWGYQVGPAGPPAQIVKRVRLPKKKNFFERIENLVADSKRGTVAIGYSITFSVPKNLTRVSLVNLVDGSAVHSDSVIGNLAPLTLLGSANEVLMRHAGDKRNGKETKDQLERWVVTQEGVERSEPWTPFPDDVTSFGKTMNGAVEKAFVLEGGQLVLLSQSGHLACYDLATLEPLWHEQLSRSFDAIITSDQKSLLVLDGMEVMFIDPGKGEALGRLVLAGNPPATSAKICLNHHADRLLVSLPDGFRAIDLATGKPMEDYKKRKDVPLPSKSLRYLSVNYALLDNRSILHLPTGRVICGLVGIGAVAELGGHYLVATHGDAGGRVGPYTLPHDSVLQMQKRVENEPGSFLIHPGVEVAIDVSQVDEDYRSQVEQGLDQSIKDAGYKRNDQATIQVKAIVRGPRQEAVSFIAAGAYVANLYDSVLEIRHDGKVVWQRQTTNIPTLLRRSRGKSIQEALDELGKGPNLKHFSNTTFPDLMDEPEKSVGSNGGGRTLMTSTFSIHGVTDSR